MSAFLGPIHSWLYNKIKFQDKMAEQIIELAQEKSWNDPEIRSDRYGKLETGHLEDIVDPDNIHGWLQERVSLVENKLAYVVTVLTENHSDRMEEICNSIYKLGRKNRLEHGTPVKEAYMQLENLLLNGMPCDRVNEVVDQDENFISWEQTQNIHEKYWSMVHGNSRYYDEIRNSLIKGMLENTGITYMIKDENRFELRKEN